MRGLRICRRLKGKRDCFVSVWWRGWEKKGQEMIDRKINLDSNIIITKNLYCINLMHIKINL